jgi:hypothetical protein
MKDKLPVKLYAKNRYLLVLLNFVVLVFSGLFVFSGIVRNEKQLYPSILLGIIALFSIIFFGYGLVISLRMIFLPAIIVDGEGIVDRASGTAVGRIPWNNISKVEVIPGSNYVGILPKNTDLITNRVGVFVRSIVKRRIANGRPPVIIPASILGIDADQLAKEINSRKPVQ